jgi:pseudouridine synthase
MARAGLGSRRACEVLITQGRVQINGHVATLGMSGDPAIDDIRVNGDRLREPEKMVYIMLNKPRGVISDEDVSGNWQKARDLIPVQGHLYPVGRLDLHSEGLMLFTNDGDLAHKLTHPRFEHSKTYLVTVEGAPAEKTLDVWRRGVMLDDQRTAPADVTRLRKTKDGVVLKVTIHEGRKRQLRRVAALLGHPATRLQRIQLASLTLGDLALGAWRSLTDQEVAALRREVSKHPARKPRPAAPPPDRTQGNREQREQRGSREGPRSGGRPSSRPASRPSSRPSSGNRGRRR